ncbi:MAG: 50S ribosomal protein L21 [Clostridia bacterium]|nr:50S ribosomal protein L21 [Clostridia bacterium]MCD8308381.1 50S ribosomal protein L21 [Clostridia bacterium]
MYAIFENGSKQYRVSEGDVLKVEKLNAAVGDTVEFPVIMIADEKGIAVGAEVENQKVVATVVAQGKAKKIIVFKYKSKKNERKKQGHRQPYTEIKVTSVGAAKAAKTKKAKAETAEAKAE